MSSGGIGSGLWQQLQKVRISKDGSLQAPIKLHKDGTLEAPVTVTRDDGIVIGDPAETKRKGLLRRIRDFLSTP